MKRPLLPLSVAVAMLLGASGVSLSMAATTKPTPKPSVKTTVKATVKPTVKTTVKATKKPVAKKKVAKKKVAKKKVAKVIPSPSPSWPPKGFRVNGDVYAKIPTSKELLGILSANKALTAQIKNCDDYACGAVQVASVSGCTWWEITSTVSGPASESDPTIISLGTLRTTAKPSTPKKLVTILLISTEPLKEKVNVGNINITCYHGPRTEKVPTSTYTPNTPSPTPTPTSTPTPTPTPTN